MPAVVVLQHAAVGVLRPHSNLGAFPATQVCPCCRPSARGEDHTKDGCCWYYPLLATQACPWRHQQCVCVAPEFSAFQSRARYSTNWEHLHPAPAACTHLALLPRTPHRHQGAPMHPPLLCPCLCPCCPQCKVSAPIAPATAAPLSSAAAHTPAPVPAATNHAPAITRCVCGAGANAQQVGAPSLNMTWRGRAGWLRSHRHRQPLAAREWSCRRHAHRASRGLVTCCYYAPSTLPPSLNCRLCPCRTHLQQASATPPAPTLHPSITGQRRPTCSQSTHIFSRSVPTHLHPRCTYLQHVSDGTPVPTFMHTASTSAHLHPP